MTVSHGVTQSGADDENFYRQITILANNKRFQAMLFSMYGIAFNPPADAPALVLCAEGRAEDRTALIDYLEGEFNRNLAPGEVRVGNPLTMSNIHFTSNGDVTLTAPNVTILGNVVIPTGTLTIPSQNLLLDGQPFPDHTHLGVTTGEGTSGGVA